jgi:hypothetical protein
MKPRKRCWWLTVLALFLLPAAAPAAEFTAQMVLKDGDKTMPGKICVQGEKRRQEFQDEEGRTVTIVRPDKKVVWVVFPMDKTYAEMPLKPQLPGQFIQIPMGAQKRLTGTEKLNGYETEKYEVSTLGAGGRTVKQTVWVAKKLGLPIKMVDAERSFSIEYQNIKEGGMTDLLFAPPPGFKKMPAPTGLTMEQQEAID